MKVNQIFSKLIDLLVNWKDIWTEVAYPKLAKFFVEKYYNKGKAVYLINSESLRNFCRFQLMWPDEYIHPTSFERTGGAPWWFPFNAFVHRWFRSDNGLPHTHPRWSITVVLTGRLVEITNREKIRFLGPGSISIRNTKDAHSLLIPAGYEGKTFTLFIVGRRRKAQYFMLPDNSLIPTILYGQQTREESFVSGPSGGESTLPYIDAEVRPTKKEVPAEYMLLKERLSRRETKNLKYLAESPEALIDEEFVDNEHKDT